MSKVHADKIVKELGSMDLDLAIQFALIWDLLIATDETSQEDIVYSKSYFSRYYCVDLATFNKWVKVFCSELWGSGYVRKRKFTIYEANYIFDKLGKFSAKNMPPQSRKELMGEIYLDKSWKKSRRYEELCLDFEDRFPDEAIKINKLPPKLVFQILREELDGFDDNMTTAQDEFFRTRIQALQSVVSKYQQLSDHKAEVYRRYIRRWLSGKDEELE